MNHPNNDIDNNQLKINQESVHHRAQAVSEATETIYNWLLTSTPELIEAEGKQWIEKALIHMIWEMKLVMESDVKEYVDFLTEYKMRVDEIKLTLDQAENEVRSLKKQLLKKADQRKIAVGADWYQKEKEALKMTVETKQATIDKTTTPKKMTVKKTAVSKKVTTQSKVAKTTPKRSSKNK